jgi:superfamily II DNA or RNA helicase
MYLRNVMVRQLENRDYQQRIIKRTVETFDQGGKNVLIQSPPGSGKTVMGFCSMKELLGLSQKLLQKPAHEVQFGWMAMRRNLLAQAKKENYDLGINCPNVHYISMFDKDPPPVDVLISDEAQHDASNSAHHVHAVSRPELVLGLSATPYRTDRMKLCFDRVIEDAGYHSLIQDGWLARFDQWMLEEYNYQSVAATYLASPEKWGKTLMFFLRIEECYMAAQLLQKHGIRCDVVTGSTDRFAQIDKFENGELDVLINVFVLTEGFDCPDMNTVFVRDSSKGPTIQMAGRVLRRHPDIPVVNIVQSQDTKWPFVRTAGARRQYIQDKGGIWKSLGSNELVEIMRKRMIRRMAATEVILPELLRTKSDRRQNNQLFQFFGE